VSLETNPQDYFTGNVTVEQHYNGQNENRERYAATMAVLQESGVEIAQSKCSLGSIPQKPVRLFFFFFIFMGGGGG
jgi:hypothetical protein